MQINKLNNLIVTFYHIYGFGELFKYCSISDIPYMCSLLYVCKDFLLSFCRGKGDNYRLGHGTEDHIRQPKQIEALANKKVVDLVVGSVHCLAVTDKGEVFMEFF